MVLYFTPGWKTKMGLILFDQTALQRSGVLRKEIPRSTPLHSTPTILILVVWYLQLHMSCMCALSDPNCSL